MKYTKKLLNITILVGIPYILNISYSDQTQNNNRNPQQLMSFFNTQEQALGGANGRRPRGRRQQINNNNNGNRDNNRNPQQIMDLVNNHEQAFRRNNERRPEGIQQQPINNENRNNNNGNRDNNRNAQKIMALLNKQEEAFRKTSGNNIPRGRQTNTENQNNRNAQKIMDFLNKQEEAFRKTSGNSIPRGRQRTSINELNKQNNNQFNNQQKITEDTKNSNYKDNNIFNKVNTSDLKNEDNLNNNTTKVNQVNVPKNLSGLQKLRLTYEAHKQSLGKEIEPMSKEDQKAFDKINSQIKPGKINILKSERPTTEVNYIDIPAEHKGSDTKKVFELIDQVQKENKGNIVAINEEDKPLYNTIKKVKPGVVNIFRADNNNQDNNSNISNNTSSVVDEEEAVRVKKLSLITKATEYKAAKTQENKDSVINDLSENDKKIVLAYADQIKPGCINVFDRVIDYTSPEISKETKDNQLKLNAVSLNEKDIPEEYKDYFQYTTFTNKNDASIKDNITEIQGYTENNVSNLNVTGALKFNNMTDATYENVKNARERRQMPQDKQQLINELNTLSEVSESLENDSINNSTDREQNNIDNNTDDRPKLKPTRKVLLKSAIPNNINNNGEEKDNNSVQENSSSQVLKNKREQFDLNENNNNQRRNSDSNLLRNNNNEEINTDNDNKSETSNKSEYTFGNNNYQDSKLKAQPKVILRAEGDNQSENSDNSVKNNQVQVSNIVIGDGETPSKFTLDADNVNLDNVKIRSGSKLKGDKNNNKFYANTVELEEDGEIEYYGNDPNPTIEEAVIPDNSEKPVQIDNGKDGDDETRKMTVKKLTPKSDYDKRKEEEEKAKQGQENENNEDNKNDDNKDKENEEDQLKKNKKVLRNNNILRAGNNNDKILRVETRGNITLQKSGNKLELKVGQVDNQDVSAFDKGVITVHFDHNDINNIIASEEVKNNLTEPYYTAVFSPTWDSTKMKGIMRKEDLNNINGGIKNAKGELYVPIIYENKVYLVRETDNNRELIKQVYEQSADNFGNVDEETLKKILEGAKDKETTDDSSNGSSSSDNPSKEDTSSASSNEFDYLMDNANNIEDLKVIAKASGGGDDMSGDDLVQFLKKQASDPASLMSTYNADLKEKTNSIGDLSDLIFDDNLLYTLYKVDDSKKKIWIKGGTFTVSYNDWLNHSVSVGGDILNKLVKDNQFKVQLIGGAMFGKFNCNDSTYKHKEFFIGPKFSYSGKYALAELFGAYRHNNVSYLENNKNEFVNNGFILGGKIGANANLTNNIAAQIYFKALYSQIAASNHKDLATKTQLALMPGAAVGVKLPGEAAITWYYQHNVKPSLKDNKGVDLTNPNQKGTNEAGLIFSKKFENFDFSVKGAVDVGKDQSNDKSKYGFTGQLKISRSF